MTATPRLTRNQRHALSSTMRSVLLRRENRRERQPDAADEDLYEACRAALALDQEKRDTDAAEVRAAAQRAIAHEKLVALLDEADTVNADLRTAMAAVLLTAGECDTRTIPGQCRTHQVRLPCVYGVARALVQSKRGRR